MAVEVDRRSAEAAHLRNLVDEVLGCARSEHAATVVTGGGRPHVTITKQVTDYNDAYFRGMLSGIEFATRGHFDTGRESWGYTEWLLRSQLIDVTVRASKGI